MAVANHSLLIIFAAAIWTAGCNHLFYYPDPIERMTPAKLDLAFDDFNTIAADGTRLHGWLVRAKTVRPLATVVHFHGNAENITSHFLFFAWLADAGFDLIEFDYRGYGTSEGEPTRAGLLLDGAAVLSWARIHARTDDLFIVAQSLGGAVAVPSVKQLKSSGLRAMILESTFSSYRDVARQKLASFWLTWPLQWPLSFLVSDDLSPIDFIKDVRVPLLFIHSPTDPVVPFALGQALYEAAMQPKDFWKVEWGGHTSAFVSEDARYRQQLLEYLCHHLSKAESACPNYFNKLEH